MKLRLDALLVPPEGFELTAVDGSVELFHLRPFSVADEQFVGGIEGAFQTPMAALPVVLRQLLDDEQRARFCAHYNSEPPSDVTPECYKAVADDIARFVPQAVLTALATRLLLFRRADSEKLKGVLPEKKPMGEGWRTRTLCFCAGVLAGGCVMSLLSLFWIS